MIHRNPLLSRTLTALLFFLVACSPGEGREAERHAAQATTPPAPAVDATAANSLSATFRAAASRAERSVVFIEVEKEAEAMDPQQIPEPFRFFFGPEGPQQPGPQRGAGSGFVLDDEGHIITNYHVVEGADYVKVRSVDRREFEAEVVGGDPDTDVAVLKIREQNPPLPPAALGDSSRIQVGDWVLALGNPLGLDFTVTAGIVSAKGRQVGLGRQTALESFIQTDAAINQGNSGGPLVDLEGRVIGINTLIYGGMRYVGYGFAVPIDIAKKVVDDILEYGYVRRPRLGVGVTTVDAVDAEVFGLERVAGAMVGEISEDSPAAEAGVETGDVIVALDGEPIETSSELTARLAQYAPGDEVELSLVRYGEKLTKRVELGEFEHNGETQPEARARETSSEKLGFSVQPMTAQVAEQLGYEDADGVVIAQVRPGSSAAQAGVSRGMKLLSVNREAIATPADLDRVAEGIEPGSVVSLRIEIPERGVTILNYRARR